MISSRPIGAMVRHFHVTEREALSSTGTPCFCCPSGLGNDVVFPRVLRVRAIFMCNSCERSSAVGGKNCSQTGSEKSQFFFFFLSHDLDEFQGCSNDLFLCRIVDVALPELSKVL